jgi:hypothetical protein
MGRVLSREILVFQGADVMGQMESNTDHDDIASYGWTLRGRRPRARTETSCAGTGRSHSCPWTEGSMDRNGKSKDEIR